MERLRRMLRTQARAQRSITYQDLAELALIPSPHKIHNLTLMLEDMIRVDHAAGRPLLAALAVSKTSGLPGKGYFQLLAELKLYKGPDTGEEAVARHDMDLARAYAYWGL